MGDGLDLGVLWGDCDGNCGICVQAGYFVSWPFSEYAGALRMLSLDCLGHWDEIGDGEDGIDWD